MTRWERVLLLVVGLELLAAGAAVAWRATRPVPPRTNLARLDPITAADLDALRQAARGSSPDRWQELAEAYLAHGFFPEADACYRRANELRPDSLQIVYGWAFCLERLGRTGEAIERFEQAAPLAEEELARTCWYHIGRCYLREGSVAEAEAAFRRISEFPPAKFQLARILVRSGRAEEALPLLEELRAASPDAVEPILLEASAQRALGRAETADELVEAVERASISLPLDDAAMFLNPFRLRYGLTREVAECERLLQTGRADDAVAGYHALLERSDYWYARRLIPMLADLEIARGRPAEAERLLADLFTHSNVTPETLERQGDALALLGREDEAVGTWQRALRMRESESLHRSLAEHHQRQGDEQAAREHQAGALHCAGVEAYRRNDLAAAIETLTQAVELVPARPGSWFYLGQSRRALGNTSEAIQAYRRCLEHNPAHGRAAQALARLDG